MNIIFQGRFPIRTIVLIGVALLITTQIYAQNAEARLSLTLRNATSSGLKTQPDILLSMARKLSSNIKSICR